MAFNNNKSGVSYVQRTTPPDIMLERHEFSSHSIKNIPIMDNHNNHQFDDSYYYTGNSTNATANQFVPPPPPPPHLLNMMNNSSYSSPSSSSSSIVPNVLRQSQSQSGNNSNTSSSASSISSTHRQFPSYGSTDFSSSSQPVTPPDNRFVSEFTPNGKVIGSATSCGATSSNNNLYNMFSSDIGIGGPLLTPQIDSPSVGRNSLQYLNMNLSPPSLPVSMPQAKNLSQQQQQPHVITPPSESTSTIHPSSSSTTVTGGFISDMNRLSINGTSPARYLFDGELRSYTPPPTDSLNNSSTSHQRKPSFLQAETTNDKFPILVRRESNGFKTSPGVSSGRQSFSGAFFDFLDPSPVFDSVQGGTGSQGQGQGVVSTGSGNGVGAGTTPMGSSTLPTPNGNFTNGHGNWKGVSNGNNSQISQQSNGSSNGISLNSINSDVLYQQQQSQQALPPQHQQQSQLNQGQFQIPRTLYYTPPMTSPPQTSYFDRTIIINQNSPDNIPVSSMTLPALTENHAPIPVPNIQLRNTTVNTPTKTNQAVRLVNNTPTTRTRQIKNPDHEVNRYAHASLESMKDEIYSLCKDQHGCRFLQRKLEEKNPLYLNMIFNETYPHVVELMTDPFGNYLCQKLLEYATDEQRTILMRTAAPYLVSIALNQHGTRALQKMIQYINTPEQVDMIVGALKSNVVKLTQDLNGNHVVQKCLYRLSNEGSQFIYDAVSENCVTVGTHKHGCCVLQRCIDHASPGQKKQLVKEIINNSFTLVQDQFGNYVAQYVLDLGNKEFTEPMIRQFMGKICILSVQKFSSNVIEKCLRIAEPDTVNILIEELVASPKLDELLRDSYANYVIQTALDYAQPLVRQRLVDNIRPIIPSIRSTPYGRRIQSKLSNGQMSSGSVTPSAAQSQEYTSPIGEFEWPYRN